jgi:hypothetical protein
MIPQFLAAVLLSTAPSSPPTPPQTPAQRVAAKALAGQYGKLAPWQQQGYTRLLAGEVTHRGHAYLTSYGPWDPPGCFGGPYAADREMRLTEAHSARSSGATRPCGSCATGAVR